MDKSPNSIPNDMDSNEKFMNRVQISEIAGLTVSVIGKYALLLEQDGYVFNKDALGTRIYSKQDVETFKEIKELCKEQGYVTKEAARIVAHRRKPIKNIEDIQMAFDSLRPMNYYTILKDEMVAMKADFKKIENILEAAKAAIDSNMELVSKLEDLESQNVKKDKELDLLREKLGSISNLLK